MIFEEKTISSEKIYEGKIINVRRDTVTAPCGTAVREIVEHRGAVGLIPVTDDGNVVLVRQFRKATEKVMLEIPAGKLEGREDPVEAAKRELKEETGFTAQKIEKLFSYYPCVGYSEEIIHIYLCTGLTAGSTDFDDDEAIDTVECPKEEMLQMVMDGRIEDGKTMVAAFYVNK